MGQSPKFCTSCGAALEEGQRFCHECGVKIPLEESAEAATEDVHDACEAAASRTSDIETETSASNDSDPNKAESRDTGEASHLAAEAETEKAEGAEKTEEAAAEGAGVAEEAKAPQGGMPAEATPSYFDAKYEAAISQKDALTEEMTDEAAADVSDIDISDGIQENSPDAMKTAQIPLVADSSVPLVQPAAPYSGAAVPQARPDSTAPMPLVNAGGVYAPGQDTQVMEAVTTNSAPRQYRQTPSEQRENSASTASPDKKRTALIVVVIVLVLVVAALVGALIATTANNEQTASSQTEETAATDNAVSQNDSSSNNATADDSTTSEDRTYYYELETYYEHLGTFDDEISSAAQDFNNNYLKTSWTQRSAYADAASSLEESIIDDSQEIEELSVPTSSEYYACYTTLVRCYYDCVMRISVICEAWEISLSYDDPTGHGDEICAPLSRDKENNTNKYLTEFNNLYKNAKPAEPRG